MSRLQVRYGSVAGLEERLRCHPEVDVIGPTHSNVALEFDQGEWHRRVLLDNSDSGLYGLVELVDNNPMVCADDFSVPSAAGTLALIGVGPLIRANLLAEGPAFMCSFDAEEGEIERALQRFGWTGEASVTIVPSLDLQLPPEVIALNALAVIRTPDDHNEIDALYDESFARSFYVHEEHGPWDASVVLGKPHAAYRLRYTPDEPYSLLTISVMADVRGKCGGAQVVHAMNVMAGMEESLGIE